MLKKLEIKDFAIIDRLVLEFGPGLNVFTGETGAGKSIIVEAIGFLLGERASSELVRTGAAQAEVSGVFNSGTLPKKLLAAYGINSAEFSVRRQLDAGGKTRGFLEGRPVTAAFLSGLGDALVDFHGQNEHQSLMKAEVQLELLDRYARLEKEAAAYGAVFEERRRLLERLNAVSLSEEERARLIDLYRFQLKEIESAELKEGEEGELQVLYPRLKNANRLFTLSSRAYELLSGGEAPALAGLEKALKDLEALAETDETAAPLKENLAQAVLALKDIEESLYKYSKNLDTDPAGLDAVLSRLDKISVLKKKYGPELADVLKKEAGLREKIDGLENASFDKKELASELEKAGSRLTELGEALHAKRAAAAKKLSAAVVSEISGLGFKEIRFSAALETEEGRFTASGMDTVEFMFSANPGYPLKPLKLTASGGEMSRVMLGLKTVLAANDNIPVLVFDELDTGVGSTVARLLGEKLSALAGAKQLFCITHMPQIAAFAGAHYYVEKNVRRGISAITVSKLDPEAGVLEIARMLGGKTKSTELGLKHARELIKESRGF
ncbi:MAG: DNA repair protein RecN [Elusimicrobia bacterium RIFOXYA12_FULL_51_18]|nr:MAG: DNA repair protein RecN [Elusimicrobia bacterium RIFOXYA12_FULL_51_18]OGS32511.1 MAG: DNA repair protein RecN [Elusimicrobia bacterium RIFOXYA2_FULL_53_38]